jgi:glycosyltransferase involved in cell wall biosynthesis
LKTVVIESSNLTIDPHQLIRTGIQEVEYQTLIHLARNRRSIEREHGIKLILLPRLPRRIQSAEGISSILPYPDVPATILKDIEAQLEASSTETWGFDLAALEYRPTSQFLIKTLADSDIIHFQSLANIAPLVEAVSKVQTSRPRISMTVYDLVPALFPEYCDPSIATWYREDYLPAIGRHVDHAIAISRHTALDLLDHPETKNLRKVSVVPLGFDRLIPGKRDLLTEFGLTPGRYLICIGSLEPRKNFSGMLLGFEEHALQFPDSDLKLVIVGAALWKAQGILSRLAGSSVADRIIRTGYLPDSDLATLLSQSLALIMLSHYEGFGLPIAQAFAMGVPAITTLGSSLPEACLSQGIFVDPMDVFSVSAGIAMAEKDGSRLTNSASAAAAAAAKYGWRQYSESLLKTILEPTDSSAVHRQS